MPKGYNALRNVQVNHLEIGICPEHGYLLTSEQCNCYPEQTALFFVAEQTKNRDFEADADAVHKALSGMPDQTCQNCDEGKVREVHRSMGISYVSVDTCPCCNGDWQHCPNCTDGTGNDTADLLADMRGHG